MVPKNTILLVTASVGLVVCAAGYFGESIFIYCWDRFVSVWCALQHQTWASYFEFHLTTSLVFGTAEPVRHSKKF